MIKKILTGAALIGAALFTYSQNAQAQEVKGSSTAGTVFIQKCEPGKNYTVTTDDGQTLELVCPTPAKPSRKTFSKKEEPCESKYERNGIRAGKNGCLDARELVFKGDIRDMNGKVVDLETKVTDLGTRVDTLKSTEITEIERFALTLLGSQCQSDYERLKLEIADYQMAVQGLKDAERTLKDYTSSQPPAETDTSSLTPQGLLKEKTAMPSSTVDKEQTQRLLNAVRCAELGVQKAKQTMDQDVEALKQKGCGYTSKPAETEGVEFVARALGIADLEGNLGGMAEFGAMIPAGKGFYFGPVVRAGYLYDSDFSSETRIFPTATEYIHQTDQINHLGGLGLVAGFEVLDNQALALELEAGASLSEERTTREMTVGTDTRTYDSGNGLDATSAVGAGLNGKLSDRFGWSVKTIYEPVKKGLEFLAGFGVYF